MNMHNIVNKDKAVLALEILINTHSSEQNFWGNLSVVEKCNSLLTRLLATPPEYATLLLTDDECVVLQLYEDIMQEFNSVEEAKLCY